MLQKLEILESDARMSFLMTNWDPDQGDPFADIMGQIVGSESPIRIVNLAGVPNEVAGDRQFGHSKDVVQLESLAD